jgi:hypothetical protein
MVFIALFIRLNRKNLFDKLTVIDVEAGFIKIGLTFLNISLRFILSIVQIIVWVIFKVLV